MTPGYRKAALLLHTVPVSDREWFLSQLDRQHRDRLSELLMELGALGIPADFDLVTAACAEPVMPVRRASKTDDASVFKTEASMIEALSAVSVFTLIQLLAFEPAGLIARFLKISDWSWRSDFVAGLNASLRREVGDLLQMVEVPPTRMREELLRLVLTQALRRMREEEEPALPLLDSSLSGRFRSFVGRWL